MAFCGFVFIDKHQCLRFLWQHSLMVCDYSLQSVSRLSFLSNVGHVIAQRQYTEQLLKEQTKEKQRRKLIIKTPPFLSLFMYILLQTLSQLQA